MDIRKRALADYLEINPFEIKEKPGYNDNYPTDYITPEGTYWVLDKQESRQAVYDDIENLIDDLGIYELFTPEFIEWIEENALDEEFFEDLFYKDYKYFAEDIEYEEDAKYGNRLNAECVELGIIEDLDIVNGEYIGELDLVEEYADAMVQDLKNNGNLFQEYRFQFGNDSMKQLIKKHPEIVDLDAVVDRYIELDGYGHSISTYDGKTIELDNGLYAYKIDD